MPFIQLVQTALKSGSLSSTSERQLLECLLFTRMNEQEKAALNQLVEALQRGSVSILPTA